MSVDRLQEKIRKLKNPTVIEFDMGKEQIPPAFVSDDAPFADSFERYSKALLDGLKEHVCAVRFSLNRAAALGMEAMIAQKELLRYATQLGYYVILDVPAAFDASDAEMGAESLFSGDWKFDALCVCSYIGSDGIRPYAQLATQMQKALFVLVRSENRSGGELQGLLTGSRLVYQAMADVVNRFAQENTGRSGYGQVAAICAANAPDALKRLREKYKYQFLLVQGYDAPNANAKNCANAFDNLGHGAAVCAGTSVTGAWQESPWTEEEYLEAAQEAVLRMKKNLNRYVTIL